MNEKIRREMGKEKSNYFKSNSIQLIQTRTYQHKIDEGEGEEKEQLNYAPCQFTAHFYFIFENYRCRDDFCWFIFILTLPLHLKARS